MAIGTIAIPIAFDPVLNQRWSNQACAMLAIPLLVFRDVCVWRDRDGGIVTKCDLFSQTLILASAVLVSKYLVVAAERFNFPSGLVRIVNFAI